MKVATVETITKNYTLTMSENEAVELMFILGCIAGKTPVDTGSQTYDELFDILGGFDNPKYMELNDLYGQLRLESNML